MNLREYKFKTKEEFIHYLKFLLCITAPKLQRYSSHIDSLAGFIKEEGLMNNPDRQVPSDFYENYQETLSFKGNYLLNLFGDKAKFGVSYKNYRDNIKSKSENLKLDYVQFEQDTDEMLNKITTNRNWSNHVPASFVNATKDKADSMKIDTSAPMIINEFGYYEGWWLVDLHSKENENLRNYLDLFELMKLDYEKLTGDKCNLIVNHYDLRKKDDTLLAEISYGIQTKKIKSLEDIKKYNKEI